MNTSFPEPENIYFRTKDFQDCTKTLTFKGWEYVPNEDDGPDSGKKVKQTWKEKLDYILSYSYPEFAIDPRTGEQRTNDKGEPFRNRNYKPEYPHGYQIKYLFDEGELTSGSLPLFRAFCLLRPKPGDRVSIGKTGEKMETKWRVTFEGQGEPEVTGQDLPNYNEDESEKVPF